MRDQVCRTNPRLHVKKVNETIMHMRANEARKQTSANETCKKMRTDNAIMHTTAYTGKVIEQIRSIFLVSK